MNCWDLNFSFKIREYLKCAKVQAIKRKRNSCIKSDCWTSVSPIAHVKVLYGAVRKQNFQMSVQYDWPRGQLDVIVQHDGAGSVHTRVQQDSAQRSTYRLRHVAKCLQHTPSNRNNNYGKYSWDSTNPRESVSVANTWQHLPHLLFCGPLVPNFPTELFCKKSPVYGVFWPLLPHPATDRNETRTWSSLSP